MKTSREQEAAPEKFEAFLKTVPLAGQGKGFNDQALPKAVGLAKKAGMTEADAVKAISILWWDLSKTSVKQWSERQDLNLRRLGPKPISTASVSLVIVTFR